MENVSSVFESLWEMFCDMWSNGFIGIVFGVVISLSVIVLIWFLLSGIFRAIDSWFLPKIEGIGSIEKKEYVAAYTTWMNSGKNLTPIHHPEQYILYISVGSETDDIEVDEEYFDSKKEGDSVNITYVFGRFSKLFYLKSIKN